MSTKRDLHYPTNHHGPHRVGLGPTEFRGAEMPFPPPPDGTRSCSTPPPRGGDGGDGDTRLYQGVRLGPDGKWRAEMVLRDQIVPLGHGYSTAEEAA